MNLALVFLLLFSVSSVLAAKEEPKKEPGKTSKKSNIKEAKKKSKAREAKLKKIVERELSIAERTMRYSTKKGEVSLRLLSSYSDMMRMVKKEENKKFLDSEDPDVNAKSFFKKSRGLEAESRKFVIDYINKKGDFDGIDRIYFTLGLNSRDYGDGKHTLKFLKKALHSTKDKDIKITVETVLGDYYYNDKKFFLAIKYYESILKNEKVEWWTKYGYNLAWCYLKQKKHFKGINLLKEVIRKSRSKKEKYIDYSRTALEKMGIFYAYAHKEYDGVRYILSAAKKPSPYLKNMAVFLMGREDNKKAEFVLKTAYKHGSSKDKVEINLSLMNLYEKQRMMKRVFVISNKFFDEKLDENFNEVEIGEFEIYLKNLIVFYDERVNLGKKTQNTYRIITSTYKKLIKLKIPFESVSLYRLALLNIEYRSHATALKYAEKSLAAYTGEEKGLEKETLYKLVIGQLNVVCKKRSKKRAECREDKEKYYLAYLEDFKQGELAKDTYIGLFNISMERSNLAKAEKILDKFVLMFPKEKDSQENLIKEILKYHQKKKNLPELQRLQGKIASIGLFAKGNDSQVLHNVVSGLAFSQTVGLLKTGGSSLAAMAGFEKIYADTKNKDDLRMRSALNIGLNKYEIKKHAQAVNWLNKAISLMTPKELNKNSKQLLSVTNGFFSRGDLTTTRIYSAHLFKALCGKVRASLDNIYEKNILSLYYSGNEGEALKLLNFKYPCHISSGVKAKLLRSLISMTSEFGGIYKLIELKPYIGKRTLKLYNEELFRSFNNLNEWEKSRSWNKLSDVVNTSKRPFVSYTKTNEWIKNAKKFNQGKISTTDYVTGGKFDEQKFDEVISNRIASIEKLAKSGGSILRRGVSEVQYIILNELSISYSLLGKSIEKISAVGMPTEYQKEFKQQMVGFSKQMLNEGAKYTKQKSKLAKQGVNTSSKDLSLSRVFSVFREERILKYDLP